MQAAEARPPFVQFEVQAVEDRSASLEQGHYVTKDVVFAITTPQGSKDRIPRKAEEWFEQLHQQVQEQRFPAEWLRHFRESYRAFCEDREPPANGTPLRNFTVLSPAQLQLLLNFGVRSIEDLAAANEELIGRLGMGGRALKQKAVEWLESSKSTGAQVEKIVALQQQNAALQETVDRLSSQVQELLLKQVAKPE